MAFNADGLVKFAFGGAEGENDVKSLWHYSTNDLLSLVDDSAYFDGAIALGLAHGDLIFVSGDLDGTESTNIYVVNSATGATVTVTGLSTVTLTYNARYVLNTDIALTDGDSGQIVSPYAGTISKIYTVLKGGAVATNNATCTFQINDTPITNGVVTVTAAASAIGDVDVATPTAANVVAAGDKIDCAVSGTPGGSRTAMVSILVDAAT